MKLKLNLKTKSIEETCCEGLTGIKKDIRVFVSGDPHGNSPNPPSSIYFYFILDLASGTQVIIFFCPYCGEELICELSMEEINDQLKDV